MLMASKPVRGRFAFLRYWMNVQTFLDKKQSAPVQCKTVATGEGIGS